MNRVTDAAQVNLSYILWVAAFNTTFLFGYFLLDLFFFPSALSQSVYSPTSKLKVHSPSGALPRDQLLQQPVEGNPPVLLEAINRNGLVLFLLVSDLPLSALHILRPPLGKRRHWADKSINTYNVLVRLVGYARLGLIFVCYLCDCLELQRSADMAALIGNGDIFGC